MNRPSLSRLPPFETYERTEFGPERPHPEESACWRASPRMAAGTISFVAVLRDAVLRKAPQGEGVAEIPTDLICFMESIG